MATCSIGELINQACTNKFQAVSDEKVFRGLLLQLLCNLTESDTFGAGVPSGVILMWSGTIATIPAGWAFCDGTNGTPNLRDRFVVSGRQDVGAAVGTLLTGVLTVQGGTANHQHTVTGAGSLVGGGDIADASGAGTWATGVNIGGATNDLITVPPYYSLAYIMKL